MWSTCPQKTGIRWGKGFLLTVVVVVALLQQGCLLVGWGAAVFVDLTRRSEVEFGAFENAWRVGEPEWQRQRPLRGIAVAFDDARLSAPFIEALQGVTDLSVVPLDSAEAAAAAMARRQVDAVLVGEHLEGSSEPIRLGMHERTVHRFLLRLVGRDGTLLWRGELPVVLTGGAKAPDQHDLVHTLEEHLSEQARVAGLGDLVKLDLSSTHDLKGVGRRGV